MVGNKWTIFSMYLYLWLLLLNQNASIPIYTLYPFFNRRVLWYLRVEKLLRPEKLKANDTGKRHVKSVFRKSTIFKFAKYVNQSHMKICLRCCLRAAREGHNIFSEIFENFVLAMIKHGCSDYIDNVWNWSENLYRSYKIFTTNIY